jgi:hypothetical protein
MATALRDVRSQGQSGKHILAVSFSRFDPNAAVAIGFAPQQDAFSHCASI